MCELCVKNTILKAYELVPEAYHQKFRNYCKQESQTRVGKKSGNVTPEKSSDKGQTSNQTMSKDRKPGSFASVCH